MASLQPVYEESQTEEQESVESTADSPEDTLQSRNNCCLTRYSEASKIESFQGGWCRRAYDNQEAGAVVLPPPTSQSVLFPSISESSGSDQIYNPSHTYHQLPSQLGGCYGEFASAVAKPPIKPSAAIADGDAAAKMPPNEFFQLNLSYRRSESI